MWRKLAIVAITLELVLIFWTIVVALGSKQASTAPVGGIWLIMQIGLPAYLVGQGYSKARWIIVGTLAFQALLPALLCPIYAIWGSTRIPLVTIIFLICWLLVWGFMAMTVEKGFRPAALQQ
jgi:hypothetical protein